MILMGYERICFFSSIRASIFLGIWRFFILFYSASLGCSLGLILLIWIFPFCLSFKIFILQSFLQFFGVLYCGEDFSLWTSGMIFIPFALIVIEKFLCFLKKKKIDIMREIYKIFIKPCRYIYILSFGLQSLTKISGFLYAISVWIALV